MEKIKRTILEKIERILDEELINAVVCKIDSTESFQPSTNDSISVLSTHSSLIEDEIQREVTIASTPIKHPVPIDLKLTPVKKEGSKFKF
jgi:hypothetical protein